MATKFHKVSKLEWMKRKPQDISPVVWEELYDPIEVPQRKTRWSSGYDIKSPYTIILAPGDEELVPTGIKVELRPWQELLIFPRSSMGFKYYMRLANVVGKIDADYFNNGDNEGHIFVKIRNEGEKELIIDKGDAFVQGTIYEYAICDDDSLDDGMERNGGIGSTGK